MHWYFSEGQAHGPALRRRRGNPLRLPIRKTLPIEDVEQDKFNDLHGPGQLFVHFGYLISNQFPGHGSRNVEIRKQAAIHQVYKFTGNEVIVKP